MFPLNCSSKQDLHKASLPRGRNNFCDMVFEIFTDLLDIRIDYIFGGAGWGSREGNITSECALFFSADLSAGIIPRE